MEIKIDRFTMNRYKLYFISFISSAFFYSALIHVAIFFALFSIKPTTNFPPKKVIKIISAQLVYRKPSPLIVEQKVTIAEPPKKQSTPKNTKKVASTSKTEKTIALRDKPEVIKYKKPEVQTNKIATTTTTTTTTTKKPSTLSTLKSLRKKMSEQIRDQSAKAYYQTFVENKKLIPQSTTTFDQIPEAKAEKVNVNCDKVVDKSIKIVSGLLGGSITCNSFDGSTKFINARLEKLGVKKDQN